MKYLETTVVTELIKYANMYLIDKLKICENIYK